MTRTLHLLPRAEAELADAMDWYEERREGLGGELLELARASFERILEAPHQLPSWVDDRQYRRLVLERFPYSIIFTYDEAEVRIVAFAHGRRKPGYWRR